MRNLSDQHDWQYTTWTWDCWKADLWMVAEPFSLFFVPIQTSAFLLENFHADLFRLCFPTHGDQTLDWPFFYWQYMTRTWGWKRWLVEAAESHTCHTIWRSEWSEHFSRCRTWGCWKRCWWMKRTFLTMYSKRLQDHVMMWSHHNIFRIEASTPYSWRVHFFSYVDFFL